MKVASSMATKTTMLVIILIVMNATLTTRLVQVSM